MRNTRAFACLAAMTLSASPAWAADPAYRFEKIAEAAPGQTTTGLKLLGTPAVNDAGVVAFTQSAGDGTPSNSWGTVSLYYGTPGNLQQVTTPGGVLIQRPRPVDINNAGQVGFVGRDSIHRFNPGGTVTTFAGGAPGYFVGDGPAIDDAGRLSWVGGTTSPDAFTLAVSEASRGLIDGPSLGVFGGAHRNNEGMSLVTHPGGIFYGSPTQFRFVVNGGSRPMTYTDPETGVTGPLNHGAADAGDGDRAVFVGDHAGIHSLFVWDDGAFSKVRGSAAIARHAVPAINDLGQVAALLNDRLSFFDAAGEHRVISVGDPFDGSTVTALAFTAEGWNDAGQLAFNATLADGRAVNVLATVPEPATAGSLLLAAAAATLTRRQRRTPPAHPATPT